MKDKEFYRQAFSKLKASENTQPLTPEQEAAEAKEKAKAE